MRRLNKRILNECPICHEELIDQGYDRELKSYVKECVNCGLIFMRKKGYGHRWIMYKYEEV